MTFKIITEIGGEQKTEAKTEDVMTATALLVEAITDMGYGHHRAEAMVRMKLDRKPEEFTIISEDLTEAVHLFIITE